MVLGLLLIMSIAFLAARWKQMPRVKQEEETASREFWMFIGSIVLLLSAIQISITTSIPVWSPLAKWITGKDVAPPVDPMSHYNNIQVWVAIIIAILSASILYLKFKHSDTPKALKRMGLTAGIAAVLALVIGITQKITAWQYATMLFATTYAIVANIFYALAIQKARLKQTGPAVAHLGFGMLLLGILLSSYNKEVISLNTLGVVIPFGKTDAENAKESRDNVVLFHDAKMALGDYYATYKGDSTSASDPRTFFRVDYQRVDSTTHKVKERFTLYPDAFVNPKGQEGLISSPASKHYWDKDIFTYVTSYYMPKDKGTFKDHTVHQGDSIFVGKGYLVFKGFNREVNDPRYAPQPGDIAVTADLMYYDMSGQKGELHPIYYIRDRYDNQVNDTLKNEDIIARLEKIIPEQNAAMIQVKQENPKDDYIVLKALVFPYINLVWLGVIVMVIGFLLSLRNRLAK